MKKVKYNENIIGTARKLKPPSAESASDFENQLEIMVSDLNQEVASRNDIEELIGSGNLPVKESYEVFSNN